MSSSRVRQIDIARGAFIVMMILGHADQFFARYSYQGEGFGGRYAPIHQISEFIFRILRHPGAPGFFFLAGIGIALGTRRIERRAGFARDLVIRAIVLFAAQFLIICPLVNYPHVVFFWGVIACFAGCFLLFAPLLYLPVAIIAALSAGLILGGDFMLPDTTLNAIFWNSGRTPYGSVIFPVLRWLPYMGLGFAFGRTTLTHDETGWSTRRHVAMAFGLYAIFAALRATTQWGSLGQPRVIDAVTFFLLRKYPPSLHLFLFSMSGVFMILGLATHWRSSTRFWVRWIEILGRTSLFSYVFHHAILVLFMVLGLPRHSGGIGLGAVVGVATTLCTLAVASQYARLRARHRILRFL